MTIIENKEIERASLTDLAGTGVETQAKRQLRKALMKAFDIYKSNVYYGILTEGEEEHRAVVAWYVALCDMETSAFTEVPAGVAKYMGETTHD